MNECEPESRRERIRSISAATAMPMKAKASGKVHHHRSAAGCHDLNLVSASLIRRGGGLGRRQRKVYLHSASHTDTGTYLGLGTRVSSSPKSDSKAWEVCYH